MTTEPPRRRAALGFILATVFLDAVSFGMVFPILPRLVLELSGGDTADAARAVGLIGAVWALTNFVGAPVLGALSDRFGRRPVILVSTFGFALDMLFMGFAPTLAWLFIGRALSGLTAASYAAASAYIADVTPPDQRAQRFGLVFAVSSAGMILGPAMGGLLGEISPRAPFFAGAGLAAVAWLYGLLILPESLAPDLRTKGPMRPTNPLRAFGILTRDKSLLGLASVGMLIQLGGHSINTLFVLYMAFRYQWGPGQVGVLLMVFSAGNIVVMGFLGPRLVRWLGERTTLIAGLALSAGGFAVMGLSQTSTQFCLACVLTCVGNICSPPLQALQTRRVGPSEQGRLQGALGGLGGLTGFVAPIFFTQVFAWSIASAFAPGGPGLAMLIGASLLVAATTLAVAVTRPVRATSQA
ncbi:MFS transporter [uncultured Phenylobacterium sp.]|uniref:MFS transporter n=1 Tax=uncultured Phenylobacterium sp. TaxID=349273 RepID=UPI0025EBCA8F|nr:MFS transporter [uncultured Phenylobacterium sp.]